MLHCYVTPFKLQLKKELADIDSVCDTEKLSERIAGGIRLSSNMSYLSAK
jgi:hypothetical protein